MDSSYYSTAMASIVTARYHRKHANEFSQLPGIFAPPHPVVNPSIEYTDCDASTISSPAKNSEKRSVDAFAAQGERVNSGSCLNMSRLSKVSMDYMIDNEDWAQKMGINLDYYWQVPVPKVDLIWPQDTYVVAPEMDSDLPGDETSYVPSQRWLAIDNYPAAMGMHVIPRFSSNQIRRPSILMDVNGNPARGDNGNILRDFRGVLPDRISVNVEGFRIIYWQGINPHVTLDDIIDRQVDDKRYSYLHPIERRSVEKEALVARCRDFRTNVQKALGGDSYGLHDEQGKARVTPLDLDIIRRYTDEAIARNTCWQISLYSGTMMVPTEARATQAYTGIQFTLLPHMEGINLPGRLFYIQHIKRDMPLQKVILRFSGRSRNIDSGNRHASGAKNKDDRMRMNLNEHDVAEQIVGYTAKQSDLFQKRKLQGCWDGDENTEASTAEKPERKTKRARHTVRPKSMDKNTRGDTPLGEEDESLLENHESHETSANTGVEGVDTGAVLSKTNTYAKSAEQDVMDVDCASRKPQRLKIVVRDRSLSQRHSLHNKNNKK